MIDQTPADLTASRRGSSDNRFMRRDPRAEAILERIRDIPAGHVQAYSDIDAHAPRLVGRVLATTNENVPWHRVVRADGTIPKGSRQRELLTREGVPMRGDRVDLERARA
jgi:methylated-DNA-protein-cysteine methyltransferase related protein